MIPMTYTEKMCTTVANQLTGNQIVYYGLAHVQPTGDLLINFQPIDSSPDPCILPGVETLTGNGSLVMLTIGGQGSGDANNDYANMQANYDTFWTNLQGVLQAYGFSGVDLDLEIDDGTSYSTYLDTLVQLVNDLSAAGYLVTAPPYEEPGFWMQLAQQSAFPDGFPKIFAYNIQLYGSSQDYAQWLEDFSGLRPFLQQFVGSGYDSGQNTPAQVTQALNSQLQSFPDSLLAFTWRFPIFETGFTAPDYSTAISIAGTASTPTLAARLREHRERLAKASGKTA